MVCFLLLKRKYSQLVKGAKLMLHQNALLAAQNTKLEEQLAIMTKRKMHKWKQIQQGSTMEYGEVATQVVKSIKKVVFLQVQGMVRIQALNENKKHNANKAI
jgi:protein-disulfide isomerase-like protein with CxxC motif